MDRNNKIGVMDETVAKLKGGPKVFMGRLREELTSKNLYSEKEFGSWINLSFREIPDFVMDKKDEVKLILRFDGIYNMKFIPDYFPLPGKNILNRSIFNYVNRILIKNYKLADKVIYQSEYSKFLIESMLLQGVEPKKSTIIMNGINIERFKPINELKGHSNSPNILVSHRLVPTKRADQIPRIIEKLVKIYPKAMVHVVGQGVKNPWDLNRNSLDRIKGEIEKRGLNQHFTFYGHIEPNELPKFYNKCDFMLNLSYADPCPNVVIEAMACGLPVVAPNSGGIAEEVGFEELLVKESFYKPNYFPDWTSWVYDELPQINPDDYVEKCQFVLDNLEEYSFKIRKRVEENFNINDVVDRYIDFVSE